MASPDKFDSNAKIAVLGAGSWGATLTRLFASNGRTVALWTATEQKAVKLRETRRLDKPLSVDIPQQVEIYNDLEQALDSVDIILFCCTAQTMRVVAKQVAEVLGARAKGQTQGARKISLISAAKGIELQTFHRMSEVLQEALPDLPVCALSGPNLAAEVLRGLPTASVIACEDLDVARYIQQQLSVPTFRLYTNQDLVGVELGGALKNVIAIAAGVVDGLDLGTNAKAALMTRGLAEMTRLAATLGAKPATMSGLAGMGDLVATCYSSLSRNYRMGFGMAKGYSPAAAEKDLGAIAEGVTTAKAVCQLSRKLNAELPIAEQVESALQGKSTPEQAIMTLMARPLASE